MNDQLQFLAFLFLLNERANHQVVLKPEGKEMFDPVYRVDRNEKPVSPKQVLLQFHT